MSKEITTTRERLEGLEEIIEELTQRSDTEPIIVEGPRDVKALRALGIEGIVKSINTGSSLINFCETLAEDHERFIILTDWDRKGGHLARLLMKGFEAADAKYDENPRRKIARLTKKELKDIEGLPSYMERLRKSIENKSSIFHDESYKKRKDKLHSTE